MTEARREIDPAQLSPSNGKETRRGFLHPFSSNHPTLTAAESVMAQVTKEADKKRPHKNSMPQRVSYLVRKYPVRMLKILGALGLASFSGYEAVQFFNEANNPPSYRERDTNLETGIPQIVREDKVVDNRPTIPTAVPAEAKKVNPKEIFDDSTTKGVIGPNDTLTVTEEEISKLPAADAEGNPILFYPLSVKDDLSFKKSLVIAGLLASQNRDDLGIKPGQTNTFVHDNVPPNLPFSWPYDGYIFSSIRSGDNRLFGIVMAFTAPNGKLYYVDMGFTNPNEQAIKLLVEAPPLSYNDNKFGKEWQKGAHVTRGQLAGFTTSNSNFTMDIISAIDGSLYNGREPGDLRFSTKKDQNGSEKLLVPSP